MNRLAALATAAFLLTGTAAKAQSEGQEIDNMPARDDASTEKMLKDAERDRGFAMSDRVSRTALESWAGCVARKNPAESRRVLTMDFTTPTYGRALRMLSEEDKACIGFRGTLRSAGLLFAGELAETLLEQDTSLAANLARAAAAPAVPSFSFTDKVAICVVRSVPGDVAALFATARDSAEESAALQALAVPMGLCARAAQATKPLSINPAGLRAMLATAAFRSVKDI